ncbi:MAG TPA: lysophospholipid acyltransferase family protein [Rhodocyclaceae bacterium]|nr:lysophospholipid acyltransferase family protein [Rhodocyclaceae bacterium]
MTDLLRYPRRALFHAYEHVAMVVGLGFLAQLCLLWLPFALVLQPLLPRRWGQPLGRRTIAAGFRFYLWFLGVFCACRFDLSALDRLREERGLVVVANHPSLLDAVMIVSRLPNAVCVMKAALMDNILVGAAARLARYIRNDAPLEMILGAREELRQGAHLVIFPEGSRTTRFPLDGLSASAGLIAAKSKAPVQTVFIHFNSPYLGKVWPLFRKPDLPLYFSVRLGRRFEPPANVAAFTEELEAYYRRELTSGPQSVS